MAICVLLLILFMSALPFRFVDADPRTDIVKRNCSKLRVKNSSYFFNMCNTVLDDMKKEMSINKYASKEFGKPPWKMYVFSQCMEDLSDAECETCFGQLTYLLNGCIPSARAHVFLDGCYIRISNYNFYSEVFAPDDSVICSKHDEFGVRFKEIVEELVETIAKTAPGENGFAMHMVRSDSLVAFGIGNCWKPLSPQMCSKCLTRAASDILQCVPSTEGRVAYAGCFLRYSHYPFANDPKAHKKGSGGEDNNVLLYVIFVIGAFVSCICAVALGFCVGKATYRSRIYRSLHRGIEPDLSLLQKGLKFLQFKYSTLEKATDCFNETNKLGHGGFGEIFKGNLQDGREIAIKRLFINRKNRIKEICNEMDIMSGAHHKNLVCFLGCCFTKEDSFVVYEYVPNRSLDHILFDSKEKQELHWKKRLGIIIGTAEGLEYLHHECQQQIIHRDIKASNILLDLKHRPKIADFGLARFCSSDKSFMPNTAIAGTLGYMAPEYIASGQLTDKVDVYSFGVLVLEIVSGVQNNKFQSDDGFETLVTNTWKHFQASTVSEIIDKDMEIEDMEEIKRVVWVGLLCTQESPTRRPNMTSVVKMLKQKEITLPMPSKPPFTDESMELSNSSAFVRRQSTSVSKTTKSLGS